MRKTVWIVGLMAGFCLILVTSAVAGRSGIWKPADNSNNFYIQSYSTGSCVVIVTPDGVDFYVFLETDCDDKVNALELFGRLATLDLSFTSDDAATADLTIQSELTQYTLDRVFEGDCRGDDEGIRSLTNSLGMTFAYIPSGRFTMGSPESEPGRNVEETRHLVTLTQAFYLQTTEVTQGQWKAVMGNNPSNFTGCGDDCPVEDVSWDDAQAFIVQLNGLGEGVYRLPTEAEWEYAARAGSDLAFANGDISDISNVPGGGCDLDPNLEKIGWYCNNGGRTTHPVAQKTPNPWGLYDMHGNVSEWVEDWLGTYPAGAVTDPLGPSTGTHRVDRGGSIFFVAQGCRSASHGGSVPSDGFFGTGLRVLRVAP